MELQNQLKPQDHIIRAEGLFLLGKFSYDYINLDEKSKDIEKALKYFQEATTTLPDGHVPSLHMLGLMYVPPLFYFSLSSHVHKIHAG